MMLAQTAFRPRKQNSKRADFILRAPGFLQWVRGRPCMLDGKGGCGGKIEAAHVGMAPGDTALAAEAYWKAWPGRVAWEAARRG